MDFNRVGKAVILLLNKTLQDFRPDEDSKNIKIVTIYFASILKVLYSEIFHYLDHESVNFEKLNKIYEELKDITFQFLTFDSEDSDLFKKFLDTLEILKDLSNEKIYISKVDILIDNSSSLQKRVKSTYKILKG